MTKIKLVDGTVINAVSVELANGTLKIAVTEFTVEELDKLFSNKENTSLITLMTESGVESGYKKGFTSFAGIRYDADGLKTVELFQPKDITEARLSNAEASANLANEKAKALEEELTNTQLALTEQYEENLALQEELTNTQLALCEIYEGMEV